MEHWVKATMWSTAPMIYCSNALLFAFVYSLNQLTEHLGQDFQLRFESIRSFSELPFTENQVIKLKLT